eukprot:TRINITY_DN15444_c0_g1_i1.p1 TRINITY_DN15444_c0_g1~~TRINITY_DN15444_c0_g1_i1.p1  ORF type:complete len:324 (-),score=52.37 TRINITY_DN15444_c0_g1_i1:20-991(-)
MGDCGGDCGSCDCGSCDCNCDCDCGCCDCGCCDCGCCGGDCCGNCCDSSTSVHHVNHSAPFSGPPTIFMDPGPIFINTSYTKRDHYSEIQHAEKTKSDDSQPDYAKNIPNERAFPVLQWNLTQDPQSTFKYPIQRQGPVIHFDGIEGGAIFQPESMLLTGSNILPGGDSPRTLMLDLRVDSHLHDPIVSAVLCYGAYAPSAWFVVSIDWRSGGEIIFCQGDVVVGSGVTVVPGSFVRLALVYYGDKRIRWFCVQKNPSDGRMFTSNTNSAILNFALCTPTEGCLSVGSFPDPVPFSGRLKRVLIFDRPLNPENEQHQEWFYGQ